MKYLIAMLILLTACTTSTPITTTSLDHIGCEVGDITDGACSSTDNTELLIQVQDIKTDNLELGFLAQPETPGNYPGVIMIHEWWGLNDNIKEMAKTLAKEGYIVYAVDLYDGEIATESSKALELATNVRNNPKQAIAKMKQAKDYLKNLGVTKFASLGWCFGGGQSLQLSLNDKLDATVIYYGSLTDKNLENIKGPVLGIFGEEDSSIPPETVKQFESNLNEKNIQNDIYIYPGVGHAFANPSGSNYAKSETEDAWDKTLSFLDTNLKN